MYIHIYTVSLLALVPQMSAFPAGLPNPYKTLVAPKCAHLTNEGGFTLKSSHTAHDYGISG